MLSKLNLTLENIGPVEKADMDLAQINIVGGHNSTGKSTVTKFLYAILRANSAKNKDLAYNSIMNKIADLVFDLNDYTRSNRRSSRDSSEDQQLKEEAFDLLRELSRSEEFEEVKSIFMTVKKDYSKLISKEVLRKDIEDQINKIDESIEMAETNPDKLYSSAMERLLKREFSLELGYPDGGLLNFSGYYNDSPFMYAVDLNKDFDFDISKVLSNEGWFRIKEIYYMDSISLIDLPQKEGLQNTEHASSLAKSLKSDSDKSKDIFDKEYNPKLIELENSIIDLMGGKFIYDDDGKKLLFRSKSENSSVMKNTASGIKQLGIIQILLSHRAIDEDSFFIFDEPEVNLHPKWQVELAKFLVILTKELNLTIYINSHSPMFIEAMSIYSEYFGLLDKTNVFLTEESKEGKYNFKKIDPKNMGAIYENLASPYDLLDEVKDEIFERDDY